MKFIFLLRGAMLLIILTMSQGCELLRSDKCLHWTTEYYTVQRCGDYKCTYTSSEQRSRDVCTRRETRKETIQREYREQREKREKTWSKPIPVPEKEGPQPVTEESQGGIEEVEEIEEIDGFETAGPQE